VVVFFGGLLEGTEVAADDLKWTVKHERKGTMQTIGFGGPVPKQPMQIFAVLRSGTIHSFQGGSEPLLGLAFVVPKGIENVVVTDPQGKDHKLAISKEWLPKEENYFYGYDCSGGIGSEPSGEHWVSGQK
jgi:hypothetical protein